jgi:hypothetical protein
VYRHHLYPPQATSGALSYEQNLERIAAAKRDFEAMTREPMFR